MRSGKWLVLGLVVLLVMGVVVVASLPASVAWRFMAPRAPSLQLVGVSGSAWHGHAAQARVLGQPLGAVEWHAALLPLLRGAAQVRFHLRGDALQGQGELTRRADGTLVLRDATFELPGAALASLLNLNGLRLDGTLNWQVHEARIDNAWFTALEASGQWRNAAVHGAAEARLGTLRFAFSQASPPTVTGRISDAGQGPLEVHGSVSARPAGYHLQLRLRARDPDNLRLQEALARLGQRQSDGSVLLRLEGHTALPKLP